MKKFLQGFTTMELLLSMGILMILIGVLTSVFGQILDVQLESKAVSSVDQNGRFLLARLQHDMQQASTIITPVSPGDSSDTLQIQINSIDYTYQASPSGNFVITNQYGTDLLNSTTASISAVTFIRIGSGDANDTVRVQFTVTSRVRQANGYDQKTFQTTMGLE